MGFIKKELANHENVINTMARIHGQSNNYIVSLSVSAELIKDIDTKGFLTSKSLGNVLLKGKHKEMNIDIIKPSQ